MKYQYLDILALELEAAHEARKATNPDAATIRAFLNRPDIAARREQRRAEWLARQKAARVA